MAAMPRPEVLVVTMAWPGTAAATRSRRERLTARSSTTASSTQSASFSRSQSSSKLPGRMEAASSGRCSGEGFKARRPSMARRARPLRSLPAGAAMSRRETSRPWATRWAATCVPMVPAPSTTVFLITTPPSVPLRASGLSGRSGRGRLVEAVDDVLELLLHHPALDLQGGRELPRLLRELPRQQGDLLDPLELGQVGGHLPDGLLVECDHLRPPDQVLAARAADAVLAGPALQALEVGDHQRGREVALVADHHHFRDERVALEPVLDGLGSDLLSARGDDEVLLAVGDDQEAVLVDDPYVAGVEPALGIDGLRRVLRLVEVALHDVRAAGQDLPVRGDPHLDAVERLAHRARLQVVGAVAGDHRAGLGEAVALEDDQAGGPEELRDLPGQGGAAGDEQPEPPAGARLDLGEHELLGQRALE